MVEMGIWLVFGVVGVVLAAALLGLRRYRWKNILWGTGGYALFIAVLWLAEGPRPVEAYVLISLAAVAGAMAQHAYDDEKQRERMRRVSLGLTA